jgi:hypothetical protein
MFILQEETRYWSGGNYTPSGVTVEGLNVQVAPSGNPEQIGLIGWLNPFPGIDVSVKVDGCPGVTPTRAVQISGQTA